VGDTRTAALYRLDADLTVRRVLHGLSISNGLAWSPDDRVMYYVTTASRGAEHEPLAGALFAYRPGVRGLLATPFAG
jgi:sugar lactone lactonase YvrE